MPQPDDGFFVWDDGILPRGWAYRDDGVAFGGPIENCPESRKHRFARWDASTDLMYWYGEGPLPRGWRRATPSESELLSQEPDFQRFATSGVF